MQQSFSSIFYDGITSEEKAVQVNLYDDYLEIIHVATAKKTKWKYSEIEVEDKPHGRRAGIVSYSATPHARLHLDAENFKLVARKIPKSKSKALRLFVMILIAMAAILGLVFFAIPALAPVIMPQIPTSWDKKMGDYAARYFVEKELLCKDSEGAAALEKIADKISAKNFDYNLRVAVQKSDTVNAFALPGGKIVIFSKLLDEVESQEEFIGILAHEAAHVQLRHGTENMLRYILSSFVIDLFTGGGGTAVYLGYQLNNMQYSQKLEADADAWAVQNLHSHSVKPTEFANFFARMSEKNKAMRVNGLSNDIMDFLSTHPSDSARIESINQMSTELQTTKPIAKYQKILSEQEWQSIKQICN